MAGSNVNRMQTMSRQGWGDPAMYRMPQMYVGPGAYRRGYWDGYFDRLEKGLGALGKLGSVIASLPKFVK